MKIIMIRAYDSKFQILNYIDMRMEKQNNNQEDPLRFVITTKFISYSTPDYNIDQQGNHQNRFITLNRKHLREDIWDQSLSSLQLQLDYVNVVYAHHWDTETSIFKQQKIQQHYRRLIGVSPDLLLTNQNIIYLRERRIQQLMGDRLQQRVSIVIISYVSGVFLQLILTYRRINYRGDSQTEIIIFWVSHQYMDHLQQQLGMICVIQLYGAHLLLYFYQERSLRIVVYPRKWMERYKNQSHLFLWQI
ncbi:hypothetical protein pb186bvf_018624 [Paramecium bursaria]